MELAKKYFYVITGFFVFIIYFFTLAPSVVQIDSGELAAVQATLGIAHPTGYPLFTIIGYIFSLIPLPFTKIYQLNLLAALFCSAGIAVFVYIVKLVLDNLEVFNSKKEAKKNKTKKIKKNEKSKKKTVTSNKIEIPDYIKYLSAVFGGLFLAFSKTFWFQSTSVEVYSLHLLLINLIILFLLKAFINSNNSPKIFQWIVFSFFLALGFSNHMTTLLILPGVAYLYLLKYGFNASSIKRVGLMILFFIPVLIIIYSYLPIRASQSPLLNWGNPVDLERILRHISGKQYQVWLFSSFDAAEKQLCYFLNNTPEEFATIFTFAKIKLSNNCFVYLKFSLPLVIALFGFISCYRKAKRFLIFLIITFLFTILYSINYDIHDIDSYFLLSYIMLAFFIAFGVVFILTNKDLHKYAAIGIVAAVLGIQVYSNMDEVNQSGIYTFEDYTKAVIGSVTEDAIIFSYQWDYFISPSYYFRYVEDYRNDVAIVDKELLRRTWYFEQLDRNYPFLFEELDDLVNKFKEALLPFERSENFNAKLLESLYRRLMTGLVSTNIDERDYYIAPELYQNEMQRGEFKLPQGYKLVPDNLLFKVVIGDEYVPASDPDFQIRFSDKKNYYLEKIEYFTGYMLLKRVDYELQHGKVERAKVYMRKLKKILPDYNIPITLKNVLPDD